ncbi:MAG TPA: DUF721 domain-containing protein [Rhodobacteraceae bacterium]|nr:DUF721 domain-containing protein [Paracoccaceae bacterium]
MTNRQKNSPEKAGSSLRRRGHGFARAAKLVEPRVRAASASRGFAATRLLTHWAEIAGEDMARIARPVDVRFSRDGLGATLTLLTTGAEAPMLEMQKEKLRERVNACYGYAAISRIRLTQTAATGFAEGKAHFTPAPSLPKGPAPEQKARAARSVADVKDVSLRAALETLGANVLARENKPKTK